MRLYNLVQTNVLKPTIAVLNGAYQQVSSVFSEPKESVYVKASRYTEYQEFEAWRSAFIKYLVNIEKHILKDTRPRLLHKILLLSQKNIQKQVNSPFFYHEYLQILEKNLPTNTAIVFAHILRNVRARLRQELLEQPKLALQYFRKDVVLQMIRLSGKKTTSERFKHMLRYYKKLVPQEVYISVMVEIKEFLENYVDIDVNKVDTERLPYVELQKRIDKIFEHNPLFKATIARKSSHHRVNEKPKLAALAMLILIAGGNCYVSSLRENKNSIYDLFNFNDAHIDPLLFGGMLQLFTWQYSHSMRAEFVVQPALIKMLALSSFVYQTQAIPIEKEEQETTFVSLYDWTEKIYEAKTYSIKQVSGGGYIEVSSLQTANLKSNAIYYWSNKGDLKWTDMLGFGDINLLSIAEISHYHDPSIDYTSYDFIISGFTQNSSLVLVRYQTSSLWDNGWLMWARMYNTYCIDPLVSVPLIINSDGGFSITTCSQNSPLLAKFDKEGVFKWGNILNFGGSNKIHSFKETQDKGYIIVGSNDEGNILVSKCDLTGNTTWAATLELPGAKMDGLTVNQAEDGSYIVSAVSDLLGDLLIKLAANGSVIWSLAPNLSGLFISDVQVANDMYLVSGGYLNNETDIINPMLSGWTVDGILSWIRALTTYYYYDGYTFNLVELTSDGGCVCVGGATLHIDNKTYDSILAKFDDQFNLEDCSELQKINNLPNITSITLNSMLISSSISIIDNLSFVNYSLPIAPYDDLYSTKNCPDSPGHSYSEIMWQDLLEGIGMLLGAMLVVCLPIGFLVAYKKSEKFRNWVFCLSGKQPTFSLDEKRALISHTVEIIRIPFKELPEQTELIGRGGYGDVYKSTAKITNTTTGATVEKEVAIKIFKDLKKGEHRYNRRQEADFVKEEIEIMAKLSGHKNIVGIEAISFDEETSRYAVIMEYVSKGSLAYVLYGNPVSKIPAERLSLVKRIQIACGIAEALKYLHRFIAHKDLKSNNVLIENDYNPKLCDFGLSNQSESSSISQFNISEKPTKEFDIYCLGLIFWELFKQPEKSEIFGFNRGPKFGLKVEQKLAEVESTCPQGIMELMKRCWKKRSERPEAEEISKDIAKIQSDFWSYIEKQDTEMQETTSLISDNNNASYN